MIVHKEPVSKLQLEFPAQEYFDAVSHKASMVTYNEEGSVVAVLHLPLVENGVSLRLFRFTGLPVHTSDGWFGVKTEKTYLAVSSGPAGNYFAAFTQVGGSKFLWFRLLYLFFPKGEGTYFFTW